MSSVQTGRMVSNTPVPQPRPQAPSTQSYTVQKGDSLWNIAKDKYGSGMKWVDIYADNKDVIGENPDLIHPGTELKLRGLSPTTPTPEAEPVNETPEPVEAPPADTANNQIEVPVEGSAVPSVDLFEEPEEAQPTQNNPAVVEEPAAPSEQAPAVQEQPPQQPQAPVTEETPQAPVTEEAPITAQEAPAPPVQTEAPAISETPPVVDTTPPAQPVPASVDGDAAPESPAVVDEASEPAQAPPAVPTPAAAEEAPKDPNLTQAESILNVIDGKGYSVAHHGDKVGGIPKVHRAMNEVLDMAASGAIEQLPEGETKDKMQQWAKDVVSGRLAQAGRKFDGFTPSATKEVATLLDNPAFSTLSEDKQNRLMDGLRTGFEMMGYQKESLSPEQSALYNRLEVHFGAPAQPEPEAPAISDEPPVVDTTPPAQPVPPSVDGDAGAASPDVVAETPEPVQAPPAAPTPVTAEEAPRDPNLTQAESILNTIDGKGYSVAHHGDKVGGIPKVHRAMNEVLDMAASGAIEKLPEGETRDKIQQWAKDVVSGRLAQAGRKFDGFTPSATKEVAALLDNPAFSTLPEDRQNRLMDGLRTGFEMMGYQKESLSPEQSALYNRLESHFGALQVEVTPEVAQDAPAVSMADFESTVDEKAGLFGGGKKQNRIVEQGTQLFTQVPEQRQAVSQLLSDTQHYEELGRILTTQNDETIADTLTHPDIRGVRVIEASDNDVAGQFLTALARQKDAKVGAEDIIAGTLKAFDGTFKDREAPFEILQQSDAYDKLSRELQEKIAELLKYF